MDLNLLHSLSNHFELGFGDETMDDGQIPSFNSNSGLHHVNGSGLFNHHPISSNPNATIGFHHQNDPIFQSTRPIATCIGQLRLSQRVTEVRRSYIAHNRVQVDSFVNYEFRVQTQVAIPPNDIVRVSEVPRSGQFLTQALTMERFFAPNNILHDQTGLIQNRGTTTHVQGLFANYNILPIQGQPSFENPRLFVSNQANCQLVENEPFNNPYHHQNQTITKQIPTIMTFDGHTDHQTHKRGILKPTPLNAKSISQISGRNLNLNHYHSHNLNLSPDQLGIMNLQALSIGESSRNQMRNNTTDANQNYDGRTHSFPCKKYGPYKCPKCNRVFNSSQKFASHMLSHYRNESSFEKKRRLTAKNKRKNKFQLVSSFEGLTVIPVMPINKDSTKIHAQGEDGPSSVGERFPYGLKIKEKANIID